MRKTKRKQKAKCRKQNINLSVAKRYGSGLLTRISRVRITSGALQDKS